MITKLKYGSKLLNYLLGFSLRELIRSLLRRTIATRHGDVYSRYTVILIMYDQSTFITSILGFFPLPTIKPFGSGIGSHELVLPS